VRIAADEAADTTQRRATEIGGKAAANAFHQAAAIARGDLAHRPVRADVLERCLEPLLHALRELLAPFLRGLLRLERLLQAIEDIFIIVDRHVRANKQVHRQRVGLILLIAVPGGLENVVERELEAGRNHRGALGGAIDFAAIGDRQPARPGAELRHGDAGRVDAGRRLEELLGAAELLRLQMMPHQQMGIFMREHEHDLGIALGLLERAKGHHDRVVGKRIGVIEVARAEQDARRGGKLLIRPCLSIADKQRLELLLDRRQRDQIHAAGLRVEHLARQAERTRPRRHAATGAHLGVVGADLTRIELGNPGRRFDREFAALLLRHRLGRRKFARSRNSASSRHGRGNSLLLGAGEHQSE
jgi:hypothetical protein